MRLARFENDRTISFIPPDGEFELMVTRSRGGLTKGIHRVGRPPDLEEDTLVSRIVQDIHLDIGECMSHFWKQRECVRYYLPKV